MRLYGSLGLHPWLTTNGILLKDKIDALYSAGLRTISIGFYGTGEDYNDHVQRKEQYRKLEQSVEYVRCTAAPKCSQNNRAARRRPDRF